MKKLLKITLILGFLLGNLGAFAQDDTHSVGSTHTFKVNVSDLSGDHTGNTYSWVVSLVDGSDVTGKYAFVGDDNGVDVKTAKIQWLAAGNYWVELTEANKTGACSTVRRVNILVTAGDVDLLVIASDVDGVQIAGVDDLTDCNDRSGEIIANDATTFGTSTRYFKVSMSTDNQPWISGGWSFDFTVNQKHGITDITNGSSVTLVDGNLGSISGTKVTVDAGNSVVILAVAVDNTPGVSTDNDITMNLVASNVLITTTAGNTLEGTNLANNTPESFVITASPETSVITIE